MSAIAMYGYACSYHMSEHVLFLIACTSVILVTFYQHLDGLSIYLQCVQSHATALSENVIL